MKKLLPLALLALTGCMSNPYSQYYTAVSDRADLPIESASSAAAPKVIQGSDPVKDLEEMLSEGYDLLGYSSFSATETPQSKAVEQARLLSADVLLYYAPVYQRTATTVVPFSMPTQSTSYTTASATAYNSYGGYGTASGSALTNTYGQQWMAVPVQQDTYLHTAAYYVKTKSLVGMKFRAPDANEARALGTQRAAIVTVVIRNSAAYKADILPGDVVLKADGKTVDEIPDAEAYVRARIGQPIELLIARSGKVLVKQLLVQ